MKLLMLLRLNYFERQDILNNGEKSSYILEEMEKLNTLLMVLSSHELNIPYLVRLVDLKLVTYSSQK